MKEGGGRERMRKIEREERIRERKIGGSEEREEREREREREREHKSVILLLGLLDVEQKGILFVPLPTKLLKRNVCMLNL